jgi:hypothetical protein
MQSDTDKQDFYPHYWKYGGQAADILRTNANDRNLRAIGKIDEIIPLKQ